MRSSRVARDSKNVEVGVSTIPNAGSGLFAKKDFKKFDYVCAYEGPVIPIDVANATDGDGAMYMLQHTFNNNISVAIDAQAENSCFGRYCNDPIDLKMCNVLVTDKNHRLLHNGQWGVIDMLADKPIKAGDEIFFSYGIEYWMDKGRTNILNTVQINILKSRSKRYAEWLKRNYNLDESTGKYKERNRKRPIQQVGSRQNPTVIDD